MKTIDKDYNQIENDIFPSIAIYARDINLNKSNSLNTKIGMIIM